MASKLTSTVKGAGKKTAGAIKTELKTLAAKPTESGIAKSFVGYIFSIPLSYAYDFVYSLVAKTAIKNELYRNALKAALPAIIGAIFQFGKLPAGNYVAGVGYGIAIVTVVKMLIAYFTGKTTTKVAATEDGITLESEPWGVQ